MTYSPKFLRVPIETSPDEVLALIFKVAADLPLGRREHPVPLAIAGVSQRWRAVALCSPEIWTTIRVSGRRCLRHAILFLHRSMPLPFRLSVNTEHPTSQLDPTSILQALQPHIERCAALALSISDEELQTWNSALLNKRNLNALRLLSLTIHSYIPEELYGPPESLLHFTALCTDLQTLRLSMPPTMDFHEHMHALQLTTLNMRCTWDGGLIRYICSHSHVLAALVLRDYSASVFARAPSVSLPSLHSLLLEYSDAALADGLINLALFLDLPNLECLAIKGSRARSVGYTPNPWNVHPFPRLRHLRLEDIVFGRAIDIRVVQTLSAHITHLRLVNVAYQPSGESALDLAAYAELHTLEISPMPGIWPAVALRDSVSIPCVPVGASHYIPGELGFYVESDGSVGDLEREAPMHACSDFCEVHNVGPWCDTRSDAQRCADLVQGVKQTNSDTSRVSDDMVTWF